MPDYTITGIDLINCICRLARDAGNVDIQGVIYIAGIQLIIQLQEFMVANQFS